jgi:hypothetical protein
MASENVYLVASRMIASKKKKNRRKLLKED